MQQLKWNSMIPQHSTGGSNPLSRNPHEPTDRQVGGNADSMLANKSASQMSLQEILASADHRHLLERNFTVRFRCLLDNTSGFLRLDIRGRIKVLHGQQNQHNLANSANANPAQAGENGKLPADKEPMLAFFGVCIPFGPPSLLEMPSKDSVFKSKHRLDLSLISMDSRGRQLLGLNDLNYGVYESAASGAPLSSGLNPNSSGELATGRPNSPLQAGKAPSAAGIKLETNGTSTSSQAASKAHQLALNAVKQKLNISAYDLVHHDDLSYMASAHQELLKTGASGLIAYRMITQPAAKYQWLQTSAKLYYKNSKPDFILCTHRPLMEEEGRDLLGKRTMDFKVTYLDVGLTAPPTANSTTSSSASSSSSTSSSSSFNGDSKLLANCDTTKLNSSHSPPVGAAAGERRYLNSASPGESLASTGSTTSLSPSSNETAVKLKAGRKAHYLANSTYDLTQQHPTQYEHYALGNQVDQAGYLATGDSSYSQSYKRPSNGTIGDSTFYDMDAGAGQPSTDQATRKSQGKKKVGAKSQSNKQTAGKKQRLGQALDKQSMKSVDDEQQVAIAAAAAAASMHDHAHQPVASLDSHQQHLLYGHHHYNHQHHGHLAASGDPQASVVDHTNSAAYQAAAAYAAQHQATCAGSVAATSHHHNPYAHHHQSLYGSSASAMVSPAAAAYSQHNSHQLHPLDSAAYHQSHHPGGHHHHYSASSSGYASSQSAGSTGNAAASSTSAAFLPATEHLLHHYTQSARSAAAAAHLAAWPAGSAPTDQYYSASTGGSQANAAWAAALATGGETLQYQPVAEPSSSPRGQVTTKQASSQRASYLNLSGQQAPKVSQSHGPASLNSDGSTHRSPLSSGESSNGSGCLAPAQAAASSGEAATAVATSSNSSAIISPTSYYLADHHQTAASYGGGYGANQSPYMAASMRQHYGVASQAADSAQSAAAQQLYQHQQHQQAQHQHLAGQYQTQVQGQQAVGSMGDHPAGHHYHAYFQANELAAGDPTGGSATVAAAAIKLYGTSNGGLADGDNVHHHLYYTPADEWLPPSGSPLVYVSLQATGSVSSAGKAPNLSPSGEQTSSYTLIGAHDNRASWTTTELVKSQVEKPATTGAADGEASPQLVGLRSQLVGDKRNGSDDGPTNSTNNSTNEVNYDSRDSLARLISSTIGDSMLDAAPKTS